MQAAKEKMEQQKYSVSEIAEACGYLDAGYFSKCFKKYYQVSPRQYTQRSTVEKIRNKQGKTGIYRKPVFFRFIPVSS